MKKQYEYQIYGFFGDWGEERRCGRVVANNAKHAKSLAEQMGMLSGGKFSAAECIRQIEQKRQLR